MKPAIILLTYSRVNSIKRLLSSIEKANYQHNDIPLVISLDGGAKTNQEILKIANDFEWKHGEKRIINHQENIGLRKHILSCGDLTKEYGAVIVLEDDLFTDSYFYHYAKEALEFYENRDDIAGISLYGQRYNEYANLPFEPLYNGTSSYLMQIPCSWGQAWSFTQWNKFKEWYSKKTKNDIDTNIYIPKSVRDWPESSWKKYFAGYLVECNKFIVYPFTSYTTNCSDAGGAHTKKEISLIQVPLPYPNRLIDKLKFLEFENLPVYYDQFMEPNGQYIIEVLGMAKNDFEMDVYSTKPVELLKKKKYVITSRKTNKAVKNFPLKFIPIELNLNHSALKSNNQSLSLIESRHLNNRTKKKVAIYQYYENRNFYNKKQFIISLNEYLNRVFFMLVNKINRIISKK